MQLGRLDLVGAIGLATAESLPVLIARWIVGLLLPVALAAVPRV